MDTRFVIRKRQIEEQVEKARRDGNFIWLQRLAGELTDLYRRAYGVAQTPSQVATTDLDQRLRND